MCQSIRFSWNFSSHHRIPRSKGCAEYSGTPICKSALSKTFTCIQPRRYLHAFINANNGLLLLTFIVSYYLYVSPVNVWPFRPIFELDLLPIRIESYGRLRRPLGCFRCEKIFSGPCKLKGSRKALRSF